MSYIEAAILAAGALAFLVLASAALRPGLGRRTRQGAVAVAVALAACIAGSGLALAFPDAADGPLGSAAPYLPHATVAAVAAALLFLRSALPRKAPPRPPLFEALPGTYLRTDRTGVIRVASGTAEHLFGCPSAELVGQRADSFYRSPEDRESLVDRIRQAGGSLRLENVRMRRRDGSTVYVDFSTRFIADGSDWDGGLESFVNDVTRRYEIEASQEASEARFRDFAESASDWLWETDTEHRVSWLSDSFRRRSSVPAEDLIGVRFWETIRPEDVQDIPIEDIQRWMEAELPIRNFRYSAVGADGRVRWRRSSGRPYRDGNGNFVGYRGVTSDITAAVEAEQRFQTLIENGPDMLFVHRKNRIVYVNPALVSGFGGTGPETFLGRDTLELVHPDDRELVRERRANQQLGDVGAGRYQVRLLRSDGSDLLGEVSIANITWDGELAILVTVRDVTERLALERQVRESESQYRGLIELIPDAFCVQCDGTIVFANSGARRMFGGPAMPELVGRRVEDLLPPESRDRMLERRRVAAAGKALVEPERMQHRRFDGTRFEAEIVSAPVVWGGRDGTLAIITDVSDRVAAEAARELSEDRFRDFAESTSDWFWETDAEHRIEWMSETFAARSGLDPANVIGKKLWETMGNDGSEIASVRVCRSLMESRRPFRNMRYSVRPPTGGVFWRSTSGQPRFSGDGTFLGFRGATSDITQERSAEQLIRESEERYRALVELLPEGFLIQCEGRFVYANASARKILGAESAADIVGIDALSLVAPEWRDRMLESRAAVESGRRLNMRSRMRHLRLDGTAFDSEVSSALFEWNGKPATINLLIDVSERVEAEKIRQESDARFRDFAESTSDWFWETDPELRFTWFSLPVHPLLGLKLEEIVGMLPWQLAGIDPGGDADWGKIAEALRARRPVRDAQADIRNRMGERFRISLSGSPRFDETGRFLGYRGSASDVTKQVDTENRLRQALKMEAIGQLTGGIAHDFNNLLAIISGNLELLHEHLDNDGGSLDFIAPALRAAGRGADLTQYLLAFSRQQPLSPRPTDINRLIAAMTDPLRRSLGALIDVEVVLAAGGWLAQVDPTQMENAILNLSLNARDAMPSGGKLTIETANATLDREYADRFGDVRPGRYLMVSVSDEGTGIPPDLIDRVFDPFVTTKEVGQGSGLGLSMVYGFVKQSGGHIRIYSEVGEGTTVRLYLPKADTTSLETAAENSRENLPQGRGETVLVVEDDPDVLNLVTILLTNLDYRVLKAFDAVSALNLINSGARPDLLFTDVILRGGAGGVELARAAVEKCPGLAVVYMSGYTENSIVHQGVLDEGVRLISKPFTKAELARMMRGALDAGDMADGNE